MCPFDGCRDTYHCHISFLWRFIEQWNLLQIGAMDRPRQQVLQQDLESAQQAVDREAQVRPAPLSGACHRLPQAVDAAERVGASAQ